MGKRADYDAQTYKPAAHPEGVRAILAHSFSERFADGMRARMVVSHHKYGHLADAYPEKIDSLRCLRERLARYEETGNAEWLIDTANFAMIEFMHPSHPLAHFRPTDSDESPGLVTQDGGRQHGAHKAEDQAVRSLRARYARGE